MFFECFRFSRVAVRRQLEDASRSDPELAADPVHEEQDLVRTLRLQHDSIYGDEGGYASSDEEDRAA